MSRSKRSRTLIAPSSLTLAPYVHERICLIWTKQTAPQYARLSRNIAREVCSYLSLPTLLTQLTPTKLLLFDIGKGLGMKTMLPIDKDYKTPTYPGESVCIGDMQVFICGGCYVCGERYTGLKATRVWDHGITEKLPDMLNGRRSHALFFDPPSLSIFVFGGIFRRAAGLDTCERFHLRTLQWTPLPNMNCMRTRYSICQHKRKAYFCQTQNRPFEVFAFKSEEFKALPLLEYPTGMALYVQDSSLPFADSNEKERNVPQKLNITRLFGKRIVIGRFSYDFTHAGSRCCCVDLVTSAVVESHAISLTLKSDRAQTSKVPNDN